jgi:DNA-directed RNA polymerase alpha subunit
MKNNLPEPPESDLPVELANPARRALLGAGYRRLDQVAALSEAELRQLHGIGPKALEQLRQALAARGLSFAGRQRSRE